MDRFAELYGAMLKHAKSERDYHDIIVGYDDLRKEYRDQVVTIKKSRRKAKKERTLERKAARRAKRHWQEK